MRQSQLFTKTRKEAPKDEVSKNAKLLIRGGFINKEMAGAYSYLPLGFRVFNNIVRVIREEMNAIGGQEITLTSLQEPEVWVKSGRWSDEAVDIWFKSNLKSGGEVGFANTHEEPLTNLLKQHISSYKDLPVYIYQIQTKFRNELRAKSGIMRTKEFVMKDLYSFSKSEEEFKEFYEKCALSYKKIFEKLGIGKETYRTFASGGSFSKFSDEFQTVCESGEDTIYVDEKTGVSVNKEVCKDDILSGLGIKKENLVEKKSIEVGNIFPLGTKYSKAIGLSFKDEDGKDKDVFMGCYGIGPGRVMGTIVELLSDDKGIIWPEEIAPFKVHLLPLGEKTKEEALSLYKKLENLGVEVLLDDRDLPPGQKFMDSDLMGIPYRVVLSDQTIEKNMIEVKKRKETEANLVKEEELVRMVSEVHA